jgi:hypothetical protein
VSCIRNALTRAAIEYVCFMMRSQCGADTDFSTFTGDDSPLALLHECRALFRRCRFRDFEVSEGIFDVSYGSSVRLENCTFTNITVPYHDYVSTTSDDWNWFDQGSLLIENRPEDDADPLFDVERRRANNSSSPEHGVPFQYSCRAEKAS